MLSATMFLLKLCHRTGLASVATFLLSSLFFLSYAIHQLFLNLFLAVLIVYTIMDNVGIKVTYY